jgi:GntR family transcriptional repressor for pyruvate dehydrogenase complex
VNIERTLEPAQAAGSELGPIGRPTSVADEVYRSIRAAIVHQHLRPAQRVTEAGLAKGFNVSKTPVREALLRLHEVGLVSLSAAGQGAHVVGEADDAVQKACEVRAVLERGAAALAAERRSEADLEVLNAAAEATVTCARAGDALRRP